MKNFITLLLLTVLLSCSTNSDVSSEINYENSTYIIDGKAYHMKTDVTNKEQAFVIKTEESEYIQSLLEKNTTIIYEDSETGYIYLFEDTDSYQLFISENGSYARKRAVKRTDD
ncbi:hypothetical protein [Pseudotamlana agarivorans]|uniref:hypothetical protein n=1 Tax=Pseudotamlana agarivorans TaxID=481183 RepID=UPI00082AEC34|nr:hypothetical protein [Tamlana agarivorans]